MYSMATMKATIFNWDILRGLNDSLPRDTSGNWPFTFMHSQERSPKVGTCFAVTNRRFYVS